MMGSMVMTRPSVSRSRADGIGEIGDAGLFVNSAADAVAAEFADYVEAAAADFALDCAADVFGAITGASGGEGLAEGAFGAVG